MKKALPVLLLFAAILCLFWVNQDSVSEESRKKQASFSLQELDDIQAAQKRAKRKAGYVKYDGPDEFMQFHHQIRTSQNANSTTYDANYRIVELGKAQQRFMKEKARLRTARLPLEFIERGPANVPGRTRGLVVDPRDASGNTWFAGSVGGGIWKTTDAGTSWTNKTPQLPNLATSTIAICQSNPSILYVGTGEGFYNIDAITGNGIFKSVDGGESWQQLATTAKSADFQNINRIVVDPNNANVLLACSNTSAGSSSNSVIMKSTDGGISWKKVYTPTSGRVQQLVASPSDFNTLYATLGGKGILKSTNGGDSWTLHTTGITSHGRIEIAVAPTNSSTLYAATVQSGTSTPSALYLSKNGGSSWTLLKEANGEKEIDWLGGQGWYDNTIMVHPFNENIVYLGGIQLWKMTIDLTLNTKKTQNLTDSYSEYSKLNQNVHPDQHNLIAIIDNASTKTFRILSANDGGVWMAASSTKPGETNGSWKFTGYGYNTTQFYGADKKPGANQYIGGAQDNGTWAAINTTTANAQTLYKRVFYGDGFYTVWHAAEPEKAIVSSQYNYFARTLNGFGNMQLATSGLQDIGSDSAPFISKLENIKSNPDILYTVGKSGVWKSYDFGGKWELTPITDTKWQGDDSWVFVKASEANHQIVWAGTGFSSSEAIFLSKNGGHSFTKVAEPLIASGGVSGFATHPTKEGVAYALFSHPKSPKVLMTENYGTTWKDLSGFTTATLNGSTNGFPDVAVYSLLVMPHNTNTIWAGTEIGIFESTDAGTSWHMLDANLPAVSVWQMKVVDDQVVIATHGRGIWTVSIPELPQNFFIPFISNLSGNYFGDMAVGIKLRESFDSSFVYINNQVVDTLKVSKGDYKFNYKTKASGSHVVQVCSFLGGKLYWSDSRWLDVMVIQNKPVYEYYNNFSDFTDDFFGKGFKIEYSINVSENAITTAHEYPKNTELYYALKHPIIIKESKAFLKYRDIAIVEPGKVNSPFGTENFYDYVVVEGSKDGANWTPLAKGYDATFNTNWLKLYNEKISPKREHLVYHNIDLLKTFQAGDTVWFRFRLYSDLETTGWGWLINEVNIQSDVPTGIRKEFSGKELNFTAFPNPVSDDYVTLTYNVSNPAPVKVSIYNQAGKLLFVKDYGVKTTGAKSLTLTGLSYPKGLYLIKLQVGSQQAISRVIIN